MAFFHCRECGSQVQKSDKFCPTCGVRAPASKDPLAVLNQPNPQVQRRQPVKVVPRGNQGVGAAVMACLFATLGIFTLGVVFVPIAALLTLCAFMYGLSGNGTGLILSIVGGVLTAVGFATSPVLWLATAGFLVSLENHNKPQPPAIITAAPVASISAPNTSIMPRPIEGLWVATKADCLDEDGQSRTLIKYDNVIDKKIAPLFDQYENHCMIDSKTNSPERTTLSVTCWEFWEDFTRHVDGKKSTIVLTRVKDGIEIDGKRYNRCDAK